MSFIDIKLSESTETELSAQQVAFLEAAAVHMGLDLVGDADVQLAEDAGLISINLAESTRTIVRMSKQDKLKGLVMTSALSLAQSKNDPLYVKFAKISKIRMALKKQILKKYAGKATTTAREILRNVGKKSASPADIGAPAKDTV